MPRNNRTWAKELIDVRHATAHTGRSDFPNDDSWRALDTMARRCNQIDFDEARGDLNLYSGGVKLAFYYSIYSAK
jgi:hypothetical protein